MNDPKKNELKSDEPVYEVPEVIYEGDISTRAGTPIGPDAPSPVDPGVDLFGD